MNIGLVPFYKKREEEAGVIKLELFASASRKEKVNGK